MTPTPRARPLGASPRFRRPVAADAPCLAELSSELGYPSTPAEIAARLAEIDEPARNFIIVAVDDDDQPRGWIHASVIHHLHEDAHVEITGMVVTESHRGRGIGASLVAKAEAWAREAGMSRVLVRSNVVRGMAHVFYERLGYSRRKTSHVFEKALGMSAGQEQDHNMEISS